MKYLVFYIDNEPKAIYLVEQIKKLKIKLELLLCSKYGFPSSYSYNKSLEEYIHDYNYNDRFVKCLEANSLDEVKVALL